MKKKLFIFVLLIIIFGVIVFFNINKTANTIENDWNMKITEGLIGSRIFYFYDNNKLIVDDPFHGINKYEWNEDIDLDEIYRYIDNYNTENNDDGGFLIVLKNGTEKYIEHNNDYMKNFFECFWKYIFK